MSNAGMSLSKNFNHFFRIACGSDANVLITGPTGSGKTSLARKIHERSRRAGKPFVVVNLATLHEGTLESELFGHERGAFTGAEQRRVGRLEIAQGGTVFLDEIGEIPPRLQARLLEFLQSRTIFPVGSNREVKLDVRIIAATHKNLQNAVARCEFREDLFFRLRVVSMELKPLCERSEEFDEIVHTCLEELCFGLGRSILRISSEVAERLENYPWPGNFRELRNVLEYAVLACEGTEIGLTDLPPWFASGAGMGSGSAASFLGAAELHVGTDFHTALSQFERLFLEKALRRYRGRVNHTARKIGLNKTTLIRRMRAYGLTPGLTGSLDGGSAFEPR